MIIINNGQRDTGGGERVGVRVTNEPPSKPPWDVTTGGYVTTSLSFNNPALVEAFKFPSSIRSWYLPSPAAEEVASTTLVVAGRARVSTNRAASESSTCEAKDGEVEQTSPTAGTPGGQGGSR
jgi:hypothetical protein